MASVVGELKARLAELDARLEAIRAEAAVLEAQKLAFETVIEVFDPSAGASSIEQPQRRDRSTPGRRVTDLLKGRNVRRGVLELLRNTEEPILASQLSEKHLLHEGARNWQTGSPPAWRAASRVCSREGSSRDWSARPALQTVGAGCGRSQDRP